MDFGFGVGAVFFLVISLLMFLLPFLVIGGVIYWVMSGSRRRGNGVAPSADTDATMQPMDKSTQAGRGRVLLRAYLHLAVIVGLVMVAIGLASLLSALFAAVFGDHFMYPFAGSEGGPSAADMRSMNLVSGISTAVIGVLVLASHGVILRRTERADEKQDGLSKLNVVFSTIVFGLVAIPSLAMGLSYTINYVWFPHNNPDWGDGGALPVGIVFGVVWVWFLVAVLRQLRNGEPDKGGDTTAA